ncbi:n-alkane-inducible cytochrome P450 [Xylariomycetidae sp. FL2044]|nr:n-alkane-inducible cytochrome P450 [Xylariomycetidae sp. FL2044]
MPSLPSIIILGFLTFISHITVRWLIASRSRRLMREANRCLPPNSLPQKDPVFGLDTLYQEFSAMGNKSYLKLVQSRHEAHGLTFTTKTAFGTKFNTCDPAVLQQVLSIQFDNFKLESQRLNAAALLFGRGILTTDDEYWAHSRRLIRPGFARRQILRDFNIFEEHVDKLIALIKGENYTADLKKLFSRMVLDSNTTFMFGEPIGLMSPGDAEKGETIHHALETSQRGVALREVVGNLVARPFPEPGFRESCRFVRSLADRFVQKAIEYQENLSDTETAHDPGLKYDLLRELAKDTHDRDEIRSQIVHLLIGAADTTASLLSSTFFMLAKHPDIWDKLRRDVLDNYEEPLTPDAVNKMTYVRDVLRETLRLFPPFVLNNRMASKDTVLPTGGGSDGKSPLFIAKGDIVLYNIFTMQRRKEFFGEDADEFRPERWREAHRWEYLPFNGGPRTCIGRILALTEASYCVARLLKTFKSIENLDKSEWRESIAITFALDNDVRCCLVPV